MPSKIANTVEWHCGELRNIKCDFSGDTLTLFGDKLDRSIKMDCVAI